MIALDAYRTVNLFIRPMYFFMSKKELQKEKKFAKKLLNTMECLYHKYVNNFLGIRIRRQKHVHYSMNPASKTSPPPAPPHPPPPLQRKRKRTHCSFGSHNLPKTRKKNTKEQCVQNGKECGAQPCNVIAALPLVVGFLRPSSAPIGCCIPEHYQRSHWLRIPML